eukprot:GABV01002140.1.p1 GENE.GABV01002140.1~~GABV01002140.1.p1  ORF type:complete len:137 (+),score=31.50 GABV01002140.1:188-598(+)
MRILILVINAGPKGTPSTSGMQTTCETSPFINFRANSVVPERFTAMADAIRARDFATFAQLTMQDSNSFHATCLDTYPPIFYMNDISRQVIGMVHEINAEAKNPTSCVHFRRRAQCRFVFACRSFGSSHDSNSGFV